MAMRALASLSLRRSHKQFKILLCKPIFYRSSLDGFLCKVIVQEPAFGYLHGSNKRFLLDGQQWFHSASCLRMVDKVVEPTNDSEINAAVDDGVGSTKMKRMKLKGKRAVVRWLKFFRWKKKKDYERMTPEEKILYKLRKAQKKEARYVEALKKIEPSETSETTHDPEILTPEEHFFFLKMGLKCKNYVPVGRRGIYQGVILNMHLHWKKHQTLQVVVKTFTPEEVREIATELARLTGGIALDKSKYRDGLRAVRKYLPKLQQDLVLLQSQAKSKPANITDVVEKTDETVLQSTDSESYSKLQWEKMADESKQCSARDLVMKAALASDSEDLSDIFETDSEREAEEKGERPLYLEEFEKFPVKNYEEPEDFQDHLRQISQDSKNAKSSSEDVDLQNFDEVDKLFIRAAFRLKNRR
ncbi:hypothetical protein F8388_009212 [Cannabis sativa]|nr:hypothetical protein F8388_009212 [Cannabis sativa]